MSEIKIDKGVPIPPAKKSAKYPVRQMQIGDSFFVSAKNRNLNNLSQLSGRLTFNHKPKRFICRKEKDGIRIWRVK